MQRVNRDRFAVLVSLGIMAFITACSGDRNAAQTDVLARAPETSRPSSTSETAAIWSARELPSFDNRQDMLYALPPGDRAVVSAFYASYGGSILDFQTEEQHRWLTVNRYPMPQDVLAASMKTESELLAGYRQGDVQAGFFYLDRVATRLATGGSDRRELRRLDGVAREFLASGSPIAGYAFYNYQRKVHQDHYAAFAGLVLASDFGDRRASLEVMDQAYGDYAENPKSLDPMKLLGAYRRVVSSIRGRNPSLLTRTWPPFPAATGSI